MPVHITDPDALRKISLVEFPLRKMVELGEDPAAEAFRREVESDQRARAEFMAEQLEPAAHYRQEDISFKGAVDTLGAITARWEREAGREPTREDEPNAVAQIFGVGGWNRYFVTVDGYIHFSVYHGSPEGIAAFRALGFDPW